MLVCKLYKLARFEGNQFDQDYKRGKLLRKKALVTEEYYEQINENWKNTGKMYVVDKKATEQWKEENAMWLEEKSEAKKTAKTLENLGQLAEALGKISNPSSDNKDGGAEGGKDA